MEAINFKSNFNYLFLNAINFRTRLAFGLTCRGFGGKKYFCLIKASRSERRPCWLCASKDTFKTLQRKNVLLALNCSCVTGQIEGKEAK